MSDPLRLAIIGAGAATQVAHLPALKRTKGVEVVALADSDRTPGAIIDELYLGSLARFPTQKQRALVSRRRAAASIRAS